MKRLLSFVTVLCLLVASLPVALAIGPNGQVTLSIYNQTTGQYDSQSADVVALELDGAPLVPDDVPAVIWNDRTMIPVRLVGEHLGVEVLWLDETDQVVLNQEDNTIVLTLGSATATVNGVSVTLPDGVPATLMEVDGVTRTMVPLRFAAEQLGCTVTWVQASYTVSLTSPIDPQSKTIILDAGHGGTDPGAYVSNVAEKTINLSVTNKLYTLLTDLGYQVVMTRTDDVFIDLYARADIANEADGDIFVSIHANSIANLPDFDGIFTYYYPNSVRGAILAQTVQTALCEFTSGTDRGIRSADFVVLRETVMPAVLVEMGYMTNEAELAKLVDDGYQDTLALGIAEGIIRYLNDQ